VINLPLNRWPNIWHTLIAIAMLMLAWAFSHALHVYLRGQLAETQDVLTRIQTLQSLEKARSKPSPALTPFDFTQGLTSRSSVDDIVRDMGRFSQSLGVVMGALTITHSLPTVRDLGKVQLMFTVSGEYAKTKAFLAELLARYPSLAVQTLTVSAGTSDNLRQQWRTQLVLYTKD
jgi:hypothetical protein